MQSKVMPNVQVIGKGEGRRCAVLGDDQLIRLSGAETGGAFALIEQTVAPGVGLPMHVHEREDETFTVIEGELLFEWGDASRVVKAGETIFAPRGAMHRFGNVGKTLARTLLIVTPAGLEGMFEDLSQLPPEADMATIAAITGRYGVTLL